MSLTRPQIIHIQRARREARIDDADYALQLQIVSGFADMTSSKDRRLTDEHFDAFMSFAEAIYWREVDNGEIDPLPPLKSVFAERGYWQGKNKIANNSRDRFAADRLKVQIANAEVVLQKFGKPRIYLDTICKRTGGGWAYLQALTRTLAALKKTAPGKVPWVPPQVAAPTPRRAIKTYQLNHA